MRWRGHLHAALSCDGEVPEGESFGSAFAAAVTASAEVLGTEQIVNGASLLVAVEAGDEAAARAQLEAHLERALPAGFAALAGPTDFGWTAGVGEIQAVRDRE